MTGAVAEGRRGSNSGEALQNPRTAAALDFLYRNAISDEVVEAASENPRHRRCWPTPPLARLVRIVEYTVPDRVGNGIVHHAICALIAKASAAAPCGSAHRTTSIRLVLRTGPSAMQSQL